MVDKKLARDSLCIGHHSIRSPNYEYMAQNEGKAKLNMIELNKTDFSLLEKLYSREYGANSMHSNSTEEERLGFYVIKNKLKSLAEFFKNQFNEEFGSFASGASSGNPIKFRGTELNRVWSGIFKGSSNKQYSAQISFVIDANNSALDIGFYFGRASSRGKSADLNRLLVLGNILSDTIGKNIEIRRQYENLVDSGFKPTTDQGDVTSYDWLSIIKSRPQNCQLVYKLRANENGIVDLTNITLYVKMLLFLMSIIPSEDSRTSAIKYSYLTPEQRARQAERRALIGLKGEQFILKHELNKLNRLKIDHKEFLVHQSLISDSLGYDILSRDEKNRELFIEVKTTTREKKDGLSNQFFMSNLEYEFFDSNKDKYKLYRVYDIEGSPEFEEVYLDQVKLKTDSFRVEYNKADKTS